MNKLSPSARALLDEARAGDEPTRADRARIRAKLFARAGAGVAIGAGVGWGSATAASAATAAGKMTLSMGILLKMLGVAAVAATVTAGVLLADDPPKPAPPAMRIAVPPRVVDPAPRATGEAAAPRTEQPTGSAPAFHPSAPAISPPVSSSLAVVPRRANPVSTTQALPDGGSLQGEMELLRKAQTDLREGRSESALAALDKHGEQFKDGLLREERLAARILALCQLGRTHEARAEAQRFLAASPQSPVAERVRGSCGGKSPE